MANESSSEPADSKAAGGPARGKGDPPEVLDPGPLTTRGISFEVSGTYGADVDCTVVLYYVGVEKYRATARVTDGWFEVPFGNVMPSEVDPVTGGLKKYSIKATAGGTTSAEILDLSVLGQAPGGESFS